MISTRKLLWILVLSLWCTVLVGAWLLRLSENQPQPTGYWWQWGQQR